MNQIHEVINGRHIFFLNALEDAALFVKTDFNNWALLVLANDAMSPILREFAEACINKDVLYVCAAGRAGTQTDDLFDMAIVNREISGMRLPSWYKSADDCLMTTWHEDPKEGLWFITKVANYIGQVIDKVVVADFTGEYTLETIEFMASDIAMGWVPPD
jgi:hypothetical protein